MVEGAKGQLLGEQQQPLSRSQVAAKLAQANKKLARCVLGIITYQCPFLKILLRFSLVSFAFLLSLVSFFSLLCLFLLAFVLVLVRVFMRVRVLGCGCGCGCGCACVLCTY
jgi:hypothetical protein